MLLDRVGEQITPGKRLDGRAVVLRLAGNPVGRTRNSPSVPPSVPGREELAFIQQ
jgi:hypothetical protein